MTMWLFTAFFLCCATTAAADDPTMIAPSSAQFREVEVYVDSGKEALAAYQIEITAEDCAEIVGVEGGTHPAYRAAPYYDPAALRRGRIVVGNFSIEADLPRGKTHVAVLHMRERRSPCRYKARLVTAASADEERIAARVQLENRKGVSHD